MGAKGRLIIANHTIVEALPWQRASTGYTGEIWRHRRKLKLSDPVSHDVARAHAEMAQEVCCVVREKPRGPRGGRGQMHYNTQPDRWSTWWPTAWDNAPKHCTFFLVTEVVSVAQVEIAQADARGLVQGVDISTGPDVSVQMEQLRQNNAMVQATAGMDFRHAEERIAAQQKALSDPMNIESDMWAKWAKAGDEP